MKVDCKRLDNILTEIPHLIKIDTQGSEFYILQGAETLLKKMLQLLLLRHGQRKYIEERNQLGLFQMKLALNQIR